MTIAYNAYCLLLLSLLIIVYFKHIYALRCFKFWKSVYISSNVVLKKLCSVVLQAVKILINYVIYMVCL